MLKSGIGVVSALIMAGIYVLLLLPGVVCAQLEMIVPFTGMFHGDLRHLCDAMAKAWIKVSIMAPLLHCRSSLLQPVTWRWTTWWRKLFRPAQR